MRQSVRKSRSFTATLSYKDSLAFTAEGIPFRDSFGTAFIRFNRKGAGALTYPIKGDEFSNYFRLVFYVEHKRVLEVNLFC